MAIPANSPYKMAAEPAFRGYIESTFDALLIFEACQRGMCPKVTRRLHERERRMIGSGSVYVFDERDTGIKRWTDGRVWSPSRILQNFLVYRELDKRAAPPAPTPGDQALTTDTDTANASFQSTSSAGASGLPMPGNHSPTDGGSPSISSPDLPTIDKNRERALVGSLTSSYRFRQDGLVKKTISVAGLHMISYYKMEDVLQGRLRTPASHPEMQSLEISPHFLVNQNFRVAPQIEIGADGRPRYRGEGDGSTPSLVPSTDSNSPHGSAHQALVSLPAMQPSSDHSPHPAHEGLPLHGMANNVGTAGPSRPAYMRTQSGGPASARPNVLGLSTSNRYEPYPPPRPGSSSSNYYAQSPTYPQFGGGLPDPSSMQGGPGRSVTAGGDRGGQLGSWPSGGHGTSQPPPSRGYYGGSQPGSAADPRGFDSLEQQQQHSMYQHQHRLHPPPPSSESSYGFGSARSNSVPPPPGSASYAQLSHRPPSPRAIADQQGARPGSAYSVEPSSYGSHHHSHRQDSVGPPPQGYSYIASPNMPNNHDPRYPPHSVGETSSMYYRGGPSSAGGGSAGGSFPSPYHSSFGHSAPAQGGDGGPQQPQSFERGGSGAPNGALPSPASRPQSLNTTGLGGSMLPPLQSTRPSLGGMTMPTSAGSSDGSSSGRPSTANARATQHPTTSQPGQSPNHQQWSSSASNTQPSWMQPSYKRDS